MTIVITGTTTHCSQAGSSSKSVVTTTMMEKHISELENVGAPNTGWGYFTIFALALVPPLWHWYMRKRLATWDEKFATAEEKVC